MDSWSKKDKITSLNLSARSKNALQAYGVHTLGDLLALPKFELLKIPNLGSISILEISRVLESLSAEEALTMDEYISFMDKDGILHTDIRLDESSLSPRCCNRLKGAGIQTVKDLMNTSLFDLKSIPYLGKGCIDEIEQLEDSLEVLILNRKKGEAWTPAHICNEFIYYMNDRLEQTSYVFYQDLLKLCRSYFNNRTQKAFPKDLVRDESFLKRLYQLDSFLDVLDQHILKHLQTTKEGLDFEEIVNLMPPFAGIEDLVRDRLVLLEKNNFLRSMGELYFSIYPGVLQVLRDSFTHREASVYSLRMDGATLQEIGDKYDLSRERVRQILLSMNRYMDEKQIYTSEDYYRPYIQNYKLDRPTFEKIFEEKLAYGYVETRYCLGKQDRPLIDLLQEKGISNLARNNLKALLSKKILFLKEGYIQRDRQTIIRYLLKKYGTWKHSFDEFFCLYQEFVARYGLQDDPSIHISKHNLMNKLAMDDFVLWSFGRTLRYYPFDQYDFTKLLKTLALEKYQDLEFSTRYFFTRYPKLMKSYDIKDEYELHNLLRKIYSPKDYPNITFLRMPNIQIGSGNREDQMLALLKGHSPIALHDLANLYEETYGVHHSSVISSYLKCIEDYHYKGIYDINQKAMPKDLALDFKKHLTQDFYFNDELIQLFKEIYPDKDPSLVNPRSCRQMHFKVYQDYCISEKFQFAQNYFSHILLKDPMYPMDRYSKRFWSLSNVLTCFYSLKRDLSLFVYDKDTLITYEYLQKLGISKEDLLDYRRSLLDFLTPNSLFSLDQIRHLGHDHPLYSKGLPDSFFEAFIAEDTDHFSSESSSGDVLFFFEGADGKKKSFFEAPEEEADEEEGPPLQAFPDRDFLPE